MSRNEDPLLQGQVVHQSTSVRHRSFPRCIEFQLMHDVVPCTGNKHKVLASRWICPWHVHDQSALAGLDSRHTEQHDRSRATSCGLKNRPFRLVFLLLYFLPHRRDQVACHLLQNRSLDQTERRNSVQHWYTMCQNLVSIGLPSPSCHIPQQGIQQQERCCLIPAPQVTRVLHRHPVTKPVYSSLHGADSRV